MKNILRVTSCILFLLFISKHGQGQTQLIVDGDFSSVNSAWVNYSAWQYAPSVNNPTDYPKYHSNPGYVYVANDSGYIDNNLTGYMSQVFSIPSNSQSVTVSLWYSITTQETSTSNIYDAIYIGINDLADNNLFTIKNLSNLDASSGYIQYQTTLPSSLYGQTVKLKLSGGTDSSYPTMFRIDDISILATTTTCNSPSAPAISSGNNITSSSFQANWYTNGADYYYLDVSENSSFSTFVSGFNNLYVGNTNYYSVSGLNCGTNYYYRIRAGNSCGTSGNSSFSNLILISCGSAPIADFSSNVTSGNAPLTINFIDLSANNPTSYYWDFGDGNYSSQSNPSHTYSNAGNFSVQLTVSNAVSTDAITKSNFITVNNNTPSPIIINNVIENNLSCATPVQLWSGNTAQSMNSIKICADASKATQIIFTNNTGINSSNIRFRIASDHYNTNPDISGHFELMDYIVNGNIVTVKYSHPKYLQSAYRPLRNDAIEIIDLANQSLPIYSIPVEIYRAPVMLVHGLWGKPDDFVGMKDSLVSKGYYQNNLVRIVNYKANNSKGFNENENVIPSAISYSLTSTRNNNFSCGKIDIIAHSMGGILARKYLQGSSFSNKKDIHKIITINTPHSGSHSANLLLSNQLEGRILFNYIQTALNLINRDINDGAVNDLAIGSSELNDLNLTYLNNNIVPSHSITTQSNFPPEGSFFFVPAYIAAAMVTNLSTSDFINQLFYNEPNDLIVSVPSQTGGLNSTMASSLFNIQHIGSYTNKPVIDEVITGLNANSEDANYFSQNGYSPIALYSQYRTEHQEVSNQLQTGSVNIVYPVSGQVFDPGDIVPVTISTTNGIKRIIMAGILSNGNTSYKDTLFTNGIINYVIPSDAFDNAAIIVCGFDSINGTVDIDTVTININFTSTLNNLSFYPDTIYVQKQNSSSFELKGNFSNGYDYSIECASITSYYIMDTSIIDLVSCGQLNGKNIGRTFLFAFYQNQGISIPIVVIPSDTTIHMITSLNEKKGMKNPNSDSEIKIYPNPFNKKLNIEYTLSEPRFISLKFYNLQGIEIASFINSMNKKGTYKTVLDGLVFAEGIYFFSLSSSKIEGGKESILRNGKLVVVK